MPQTLAKIMSARKLFVLLTAPIDNTFPSYLYRIKRGIAHGGGISMSAELDPSDRINPVRFATALNYADAISDLGGINRGHTISSSNSYGGGISDGNALAMVNGGTPYASGDSRTWVPSGNGHAYVNNIGFSGSSGGGMGHGSARGGVGGYPYGF